MNTTIRKIGPGDRTLVFLFSGIAKAARGAALPLLIAASAILPARGDGLSITPATLPDGMEGVPYRQTLFVEGGDQTYYEWYDDEVSIGTYYYQVTAVYENGCESEPAPAFDNPTVDYVEVYVDAIGENTANVAIYPNPTNGNVKIEAEGMNHITVVSVLGQMVYDADVNADELELNMAQFNTGVYVVRIVTENGISTQRVTVVR